MGKAKVKTIKELMRAIRICRKRGYQFELVATRRTMKSRNPANLLSYGAIYWRSPTSSLWSPIEVVHMELCQESHKPIKLKEKAATDMGLPEGKAKLVNKASAALPGYHRGVRRRLLKACGLS